MSMDDRSKPRTEWRGGDEDFDDSDGLDEGETIEPLRYVAAEPLFMDEREDIGWYHPSCPPYGRPEARWQNPKRFMRYDMPFRPRGARGYGLNRRVSRSDISQRSVGSLPVDFNVVNGERVSSSSFEMFVDESGMLTGIVEKDQYKNDEYIWRPLRPTTPLDAAFDINQRLLEESLLRQLRSWERRSQLPERAARAMTRVVRSLVWYPYPQGIELLKDLHAASPDEPHDSPIMQLVTGIGGNGTRVIVKVDEHALAYNATSMLDNLLTILQAGGSWTLSVALSVLQLVDEGARSVRLFKLAASDWKVFSAALGTSRRRRIKVKPVSEACGLRPDELVPYWTRLEQVELIVQIRPSGALVRYIAPDFTWLH